MKETLRRAPADRQRLEKRSGYNERDAHLIGRLVDRAITIFPDRRESDVRMDFLAVHLKTPMRLQEWLEADDFNFIHDVVGIERHLDRQNFVLKDGFSPRFLVRGEASVPGQS